MDVSDGQAMRQVLKRHIIGSVIAAARAKNQPVVTDQVVMIPTTANAAVVGIHAGAPGSVKTAGCCLECHVGRARWPRLQHRCASRVQKPRQDNRRCTECSCVGACRWLLLPWVTT